MKTQNSRRNVLTGLAGALATIGLGTADAKEGRKTKKRKGRSKRQSANRNAVCYNRSLSQGSSLPSGVNAQSAWISSYLCDQRVTEHDEVCGDYDRKLRCDIEAKRICRDYSDACKQKVRQNCLADSCFVTGYPCHDEDAACVHGL